LQTVFDRSGFSIKKDSGLVLHSGRKGREGQAEGLWRVGERRGYAMTVINGAETAAERIRSKGTQPED